MIFGDFEDVDWQVSPDCDAAAFARDAKLFEFISRHQFDLNCLFGLGNASDRLEHDDTPLLRAIGKHR